MGSVSVKKSSEIKTVLVRCIDEREEHVESVDEIVIMGRDALQHIALDQLVLCTDF
jgi:methionine synthase II (cobalamin-independent)